MMDNLPKCEFVDSLDSGRRCPNNAIYPKWCPSYCAYHSENAKVKIEIQRLAKFRKIFYTTVDAG